MQPYGRKTGGRPGCNCGVCRKRGWREGAEGPKVVKAYARSEGKREALRTE